MIPERDDLLAALQTAVYVGGYSHTFYRYPARFSPEFAREAIRAFTQPGDLVLDPFMGGGTTLVEALAAGRRAMGLDLNPLAWFVTNVKTTPLGRADHAAIVAWATTSLEPDESASYVEDVRTHNLPPEIAAVMAPYLIATEALKPSRRKRFARCVLLQVSQWALESREALPGPAEIRARITQTAQDMLDGLDAFVQAAAEKSLTMADLRRYRRLVLTTTARRYWLRGARSMGKAKLVLTSPPYPGVHVLYHRWQVQGRRETPAPFWLTNLQDGRGEAFYSFGSRTPTGLRSYFSTLERSFQAIRHAIGPETLVAQLVAFADVEQHLPAYLETMEAGGFKLADEGEQSVSFPWRRVPHRRWYMRIRDPQVAHQSANEVLLLHRLKPT